MRLAEAEARELVRRMLGHHPEGADEAGMHFGDFTHAINRANAMSQVKARDVDSPIDSG